MDVEMETDAIRNKVSPFPFCLFCFCLVLSYLILSCLALPCLVLSCLVSSCRLVFRTCIDALSIVFVNCCLPLTRLCLPSIVVCP
jgi:hypothetical protein